MISEDVFFNSERENFSVHTEMRAESSEEKRTTAFRLWESILDLIFPKRCVWCRRLGSYLCENCFSKIEYIEKPICPVCQRQAIGGKTHPGCQKRLGLDGLVVAARYNGAVKKAIAKVKYRWEYDIGKLLADLIGNCIWKFDLPKDAVLVPVPLHLRRKRWRGFNQAEILTSLLCKRFGVDSAYVLKRVIDTGSQVGLSKDERLKNIQGAFALLDKTKVSGLDFILVDDVYTSGATLSECAKVLKRAGAKSVWAMAVALG